MSGSNRPVFRKIEPVQTAELELQRYNGEAKTLSEVGVPAEHIVDAHLEGVGSTAATNAMVDVDCNCWLKSDSRVSSCDCLGGH